MGNANSLDYKRILVPFSEEQLAQIFKNYDRNGDGRLTKEELKEAFNYLGSRNSDFRAGQALRDADINGDGVISWDEMNKLIMYAKRCNYAVS